MEFGDLQMIGWISLLFSAFIQGMSKGGVPGLSIMAIPLVAMVIPGKASTGLVLPMLIIGDLFALAYWRKSLSLRDLLRALPWAILGVVAGWLMLGKIPDSQMKPIIGAIVLFILGIHVVRRWRSARNLDQKEITGPAQYIFPAFMGSLGGVTTMLANAAGPVIGAYLLSLKLSKETFLGTSAWFFFIINWIKVPFMMQQDMITVESLKINFFMIPALVLGVSAGIFVVKRINQKAFDTVVTALAALASLRLLF